MISFGSTFWKCPECKAVAIVESQNLAEIGEPFCDCKEDMVMEAMDDPIPTIITVFDGAHRLMVGIGLRFPEMTPAEFNVKAKALWEKYMSGSRIKTFAQWSSELKTGILFLEYQSTIMESRDED